MNFSIKQIALKVKKFHPQATVEFGDKGPDKRSYKVDFSLYKKLAKNYQPTYDLEKSIKEITNCLRKIGINKIKKNYNNYFRLNILKKLKKQNKISKNLNWI